MASNFKQIAAILLLVTTLELALSQLCPESQHYCDPDSNKFYSECMPFLEISDSDPYHKCGTGLICKDECSAPCVSSTTLCSCPGGAKTFYCVSASSFVLCDGTSPTSGTSSCLHGLACNDANEKPCVDPTASTTPMTTTTTTPTPTPTTPPPTTPTITPTTTTTTPTTTTTTPTTTSTTTTTTTTAAPTTVAPVTCTKPGKFPFHHDCKSFYWCSALKAGGFLQTADRCAQLPLVGYFDEESKVCTSNIAVCGHRPNPW